MNKQSTGTRQDGRLPNNLLDNLFQMDDRSMEDLLNYIIHYLENVQYYNLKNEADGNWKDLILKKDSILYMSYIIKYPLEEVSKNQVADIILLMKWIAMVKEWYETLYELKEDKLASKIEELLSEVFFDGTQSVSDAPSDTSVFPIRLRDNSEANTVIEKGLLSCRKVIIYIQNFTKDYLRETLYSNSEHVPNNALYITFVLLYQNIQKTINNLSRRHLDFYYKDVLQLTTRKGTPTKSIVVFQLFPTVPVSIIPQGTLLTAGKIFGSKVDVLFEMTKPLTAYAAEVVDVQTLYFNKSPYIKIGTDVPTISNVVLKNLFDPSGTKDDSFAVFGADDDTRSSVQVDETTVGNMGFVIGSPVLYLSEGNREITIQFNLENQSASAILWALLTQASKNTSSFMDKVFSDVFDNAFTISYTTILGWQKLNQYQVLYDQAAHYFSVKITLAKSDPACDVYTLAGFRWPSIKFELNELSSSYIYSFLKEVLLDSIKINVHVQDLKNISVYNNIGKQSLSKAYDLFGPIAPMDSFLLIGHSELFKKKIDRCILHFDWSSVPNDFGGFESYYSGYSEPYTNDSFQVQVKVLSEGNWLPGDLSLSPPVNLFSFEDCITPEGYSSIRVSSSSNIDIPKISQFDIARNFDLTDPLRYSVTSIGGFIKLTLVAPSGGFGTQVYQNDFASISIYNARHKQPLPYTNKPFIPKVDALAVGYMASDELIFSQTGKPLPEADDCLGEFFHINPYNIKKIPTNQTGIPSYVLPEYPAEGYLSFGLKGLTTPLVISLYFHFVHSNTAVSNSNDVSVLIWEYYQSDQWVELDPKNIISDSTNGFIKSGIISLQLPEIETEKTNGIIYLRISPEANAHQYPSIAGIYPNATEVICTSLDTSVVGKIVTTGSINKIEGKNTDVKVVLQPTDSYGGIEPEVESDFYTRTSELLRHKSRAVTFWDYERMVLEYFTTVKIVKCTNLNEKFEPIPGNVTIIVLSNQWSLEKPHYFNVDELAEIYSFLKTKANPFVTVNVVNPVAEYLIVHCLIESSAGNNVSYSQYDAGSFISSVNDSINDFLSPLSNSANGIGGIGGSMSPQMVTSYLENLPYVQSVKKLYIEHILSNGFNTYTLEVYEMSSEKEIFATTPYSILIPVLKHSIIVSQNGENDIPLAAAGVGTLEIGLDFIL